MNEGLRSFLPTIAILGPLGLIALFLTLSRGWADDSKSHITGAVRIAIFTIAFQAVHFAEELSKGLYERLPALFGLEPISMQSFVTFNVIWLGIWCVCVWALATRLKIALFPLWFLGIASIMNGVAHPLLSLLAGGYFPGLVTSPFVGVMGVLLVGRLLIVTKSAGK